MVCLMSALLTSGLVQPPAWRAKVATAVLLMCKANWEVSHNERQYWHASGPSISVLHSCCYTIMQKTELSDCQAVRTA